MPETRDRSGERGLLLLGACPAAAIARPTGPSAGRAAFRRRSLRPAKLSQELCRAASRRPVLGRCDVARPGRCSPSRPAESLLPDPAHAAAATAQRSGLLPRGEHYGSRGPWRGQRRCDLPPGACRLGPRTPDGDPAPASGSASPPGAAPTLSRPRSTARPRAPWRSPAPSSLLKRGPARDAWRPRPCRRLGAQGGHG